MKVADLHTLDPGMYQIVLRGVGFVPLGSDDSIWGDLVATVYVDEDGAQIPEFYSHFNPSDGTEGFDPGDLALVLPNDEVDVIKIR